jgi:citrate lyase alpha subunit
MLRSAATPYPERPCCMKQNQLETLPRIQMVCDAETLCTLLGSDTEL